MENSWNAIDCEFRRNLKCIVSSADGKRKFAITDTKLYVPVITLSTEDNIKLLKRLESGFKTKINWNKSQSQWEIKNKNDIFIT